MLIQRRLLGSILELSATEPLVLVEGAPRCGLSTLAGQLVRAAGHGSLLAQARSELGRALLADPPAAARELGLDRHALVAVDGAGPETLAAPAPALGPGGPRLVLFGRLLAEAAPGLPRLELGPFSLAEVGPEARRRHWLRGGLPEAFAAPSDEAAAAWLARYADSISEERFAAAGLSWAPGRSRALLAMVAEAQGACFNEAAAARSLGLSRPTVARALAALVRAGLVRVLPNLAPEEGRRAPRQAVPYLRDSGLYHAVSGLAGMDALLSSARLAASWEGYALEQLISALPAGVEAARCATRSGPALELVLSRGSETLVAASIRWARPSGPGRAAVAAAERLGAPRRWLILPECEERELAGGYLALGLARAAELVGEL